MISGNNRRGEKMLKKQQSLDRYGLNSMSSNSVKTTLMRNALSNEDLVDDLEKQELTSRLEDAAAAAKIAEEAYVANLKMLKKQKAKFLRLQKILSRNVILIPLCAVFSVLSAFTIFASTLTDHYELISYDVEFLRRQVEFDNNRTLGELNQRTGLNWTLAEFVAAVHARSFDPPPPPPPQQLSITTPSSPTSQADSEYRNDLNEKRIEMIRERLQSTYLYEMSDMIRDYYIVRRITYPPLSVPRNNQNSSIKMNILYETHSGIWKLCNYLSNQSRLALRVEKCTFYKTTNIEHDSTMIEYHHHHNKHLDSDTSSDPGRDLIRMHNAAACCTIVSYFLLVVSWITGLTAAFTKRVPVSMASWVLNLLTAVFLFLMLAIFHRKILIESKRTECLDLKIVFNIVCSSRTVKFGYSLGLTWLAFIFTTINAFCWMHITKMQKLLFVHGYYYN